MSLKKEVEKLMEESGFEISRYSSGGIIWTDGVSLVNTAQTPSDHRALLNIRADVRRAIRKREEARAKPIPIPASEVKNMAERKIIRGEDLKTALSIATRPTEPMTPEKKPPTEAEVKAMLIGWFNDGVDFEDMEKRLAYTGYVSPKSAQSLKWQGIKYRLNEWGFSRQTRRSPAPRGPAPKPEVVEQPKRQAVVTAPTSHLDRLNAVKVLLETYSIKSDDRIAMALLIIG